MTKSITPILLLRVLCLSLTAMVSAAADYQPPSKAEALGALKTSVSKALKPESKISAWLTVFRSYQKVELLSADDKCVTVRIQGNKFEQPWDKIAPKELADLAIQCVQNDASRALIVADFAFSESLNQKGSEALTLAAQIDPKIGAPLAERLELARGSTSKASATTSAVGASEGSGDQAEQSTKQLAWGRSIFSAPGKINRDAYLREALDWSTQAVHLRLGPDYAFYHKSGKVETPPLISQPPEKIFKPARNGQGMGWTVGGPPADNGGDYSSTHAQLMYAPDKAGDPGVDRISVLDMAHNVFTYKPEPTWWGGFHPEPGVKTPAWLSASGGNIGSPLAMARGYNMWCNSAVMLFSTGLVGTAGTCTSQNTYPFFKFPSTKVPTAIALTSRNEFALITVWDTEKLKGQLAVLALDSVNKESLMGLYSWHEPKPGLPNVGGFQTLKLLGYIDLPGMNAPTAISAYGCGWSEWLHSPEGKNALPRELNMQDAKVREMFSDKKNWNYRWLSNAGFAVIVSKYEDKIAFVDLQPLFAYMRDMYFGTEEKFKKTLDFGPDAKQWPYTFEIEPRQKPIVVSVQSTPAPTPTAVICSPGRDYHDANDSPSVAVAFQEGKLGIYKVYKTGEQSIDGPLDPSSIACVAAVPVGRNPCCLTHSKDALNNTFVVLSRGDRMIQWVQTHGKTATVLRTLRDSRLIDPVYCEMADTHGTESHVLSVCDFKGRKVINYRYGPVIFHTNGGAKFPVSDEKDEFECGGTMEFPGYPYQLCGTNVN